LLFGVYDSFIKEGASQESPISGCIGGFVFILIYPIITYINSKKMFSSSVRLQEEITYEFTNDKIKITGETFNSEMDWAKTYKVLELKEWILIYQNKMIANVIPKELFGDNLQEFKVKVQNNNIKAKFK
jgi:hypothetical protein